MGVRLTVSHLQDRPHLCAAALELRLSFSFSLSFVVQGIEPKPSECKASLYRGTMPHQQDFHFLNVCIQSSRFLGLGKLRCLSSVGL